MYKPRRMSDGDLDQFCARVLGDGGLQAALAEPMDPEAFVALAVETGRRAGLHFDADAVRARLRASREAFLLRWIAP